MTNSKNKSFILHLDSLVILEKLSDEQAGKIFKAIYTYQKTNEILQLDFALDLAFTPFLNQFARDEEKYKITCERRKEAGSKGGKQKVANASKSKQKVANLADNKNKSDSKNDSDSDSESKNIIKSQFESFWNLYDKKESRKDCEKKFQLALRKESFEKIMAGLQAYAKVRGSDKKYWKLPETWLNKESWNDEYSAASLKSINFIEELNSIAGEQLFKVIDTHYDKALLRCITIDHKEQALKLDGEKRKKIKEKIAEKYPNKTLEVTY